MTPKLRASLIATSLLLFVFPGVMLAKTSDRKQAMNIEADTSDCQLGNNRKCTVNGKVVITQGTLTINSASGIMMETDGRPSRAQLSGGVLTNQLLDDGTPVKTSSSNVDYDFNTGIIILTGNVIVTQTRGEMRGARMVYNTKTGQVQSGGGGQRVKMTLQPKPGA